MKILIADDVEATRLSLQKFLEKMGHEVVSCKDGKEVLSKLFVGDLPQLVFLDWMMPNVNGLEVCRRIRQNQSLDFTYIVMVTAKTSSEDVVTGLRCGANDYIMKPLDPEELRSRLMVALQIIELQNIVARQRTKLISSSKMAALGEMAAGIAHEVGNPLSIIAQQTEKLLHDFESDPDAEQKLHPILKTTEKISRLIDGLRSFAAENKDEEFSPTSVRSMLAQLFAYSGERLKSNGIGIRVKPFDEKLEFDIQPFQVCQALMGLVQNSVEAVGLLQDKWIEFEIFDDADKIHIALTDSGLGIPIEIQAKIMQPFFTTKDSGRNSGLGLSVAKGVADAHSGSLILDTTCLHTRFVLSLPKKNSVKRAKAA